MIAVRTAGVRRWCASAGLVLLVALAGCSSGVRKPEPAPLAPSPDLIGVRQAWTASLGEVDFPLVVQAVGSTVALADGEGRVSLLDARTGEVLWRSPAVAALTAGVGHDGRTAAVVTVGNELVALEDGRELWRQRLPAPAYTPPLVAGARVFVLGADRTVSAFDGRSGRRLWSQPRTGEALVLRQPGILMAVGDTLVVGLAGRLVGMNPLNGTARWELAIASPRGTNDVERLVDLVQGVSRQGSVVCARAFQAAIGCVDAARGVLLWNRPAAGAAGLHGDAVQVLGVEFDGSLVAWRRSDGEPVWRMERLRYRKLTAPLLLGPSVVLGDDGGRLHFLSAVDGALQARIETDGSPIAATPVLAGNTLVVVTRRGTVYGFRPE